jgi:L-iditol 2-dehydrogenase
MMDKQKIATLDRKRPAEAAALMRAAVYRGRGSVSTDSVPLPEISAQEMLVRVHSCGICGTDLKKIENALVEPPRIFGHEIAGTVEKVGKAVSTFAPGNRVALYHHIPCRRCYYCRKKLFSQCDFYRRTGTTAGFEPAGGGFAEFVRVMDWIVREGTVPVPDDISFEEASFLEPLNTCLKALETAELGAGEIVVIFGQGPVGLLLMQAAVIQEAQVLTLDPIQKRVEISRELGATVALNSNSDAVGMAISNLTQGRGADLTIVATAAPQAIADAQNYVRRGGRVLLFAQTVPGEMISVDASRICMEEKTIMGSYSSSVELHEKAADLLFTRSVKVSNLVTHRFSLDQFVEGIFVASHPSENSLKVLIQP